MMKDVLPALMNLEDWKRVKAPLAAIKKLSAQRKLKLLVVVFPTQFEVYPGYAFAEPRRTIHAMLNELAIPFVDLREAFSAGGGDALFPFRSDTSHPGREGYAIAARETAAALKRLGWLGAAR